MSRLLRNTVYTCVLLSASIGTAIAAPRVAANGSANALRVTMVPATSAETGMFLGNIRFSMTNTSSESVQVLKWQTPFEGVEHNLFEVYRGGDRVEYNGMYAKRGAPGPEDYMTFAPGETKRIVLDLSDTYDFSTSGMYQLKFDTYLQDARVGGRELAKMGNQLPRLESFPLVLWVDGSDTVTGADAQQKQLADDGADFSAKAATLTYTKCTTTQISALPSAVNLAASYASTAAAYNTGVNGERYRWWFDYTANPSTTGYNTVKSNFSKISTAFNSAAITIDCGCKKTYYAYVYPNQPYKIYVCKAFWAAPNGGTDSRAGTLVHEMSHFDIVANTDDHVYGQTGAHNLAISNPANARANADNHEYFAENTPPKN